MKLRFNQINFSLLTVLLLVGLLAVVYGFGKQSPSPKEFLTLMVQYEKGGQYIYISRSDMDFRKYGFIKNDLGTFERKKMTKMENVQYEDRPLDSIFDNTYILQLLGDVQKEGWVLESHDFSIGKAASASESSMTTVNTDWMSFYLFTR